MACSVKSKSRAVVPAVLILTFALVAQSASAQARPLPPNVAQKFAFGKSAYVKNEHGGNIAFEAISSDIQGWGRFTLLNSPEKADFVVEVSSYEGGSVTSTSRTDYAPDGKPQQSSGASKNLSGSTVAMKIYDPKTQRELWSGTEKVKSAFKKKSEEDNVVAAAEKLFLRFHDSVEPPAK